MGNFGMGAEQTFGNPAYNLERDPSLPVEEAVRQNLRQVFDPEIGLEVIQLGLIRDINIGENESEVKMILTTPFCPYGGWLIQQIKDVAEGTVGKPVKITVLPDLWDPSLMEDPGLLSGW